MNILFVSTTYPSNRHDWRGRFIERMLNSISNDTSLNLTVWAPPGEIPPNTKNCVSQKDSLWLKSLMQKGGIAHLLRTHPLTSIVFVIKILASLFKTYRKNSHFDVIHANWIQNAIPLITTSTPVVISVLGSDFALLKLPGMKHILRWVFNKRKSILAPNAKWMLPELTKNFGDCTQIVHVPFGVDTRWFKIKRNLQNFPTKRNWIAVTRLTENKLGSLFDWGKNVFNENDVLHLFGPKQEDIEIPDWITYHGPATPEQLMTEWFPKSAGLITLSRHDEGRPQVIIEAMASGLPIIASDLAAHTDIIEDGVCGIIATSETTFQKAINKLSDIDYNMPVGDNARSKIYNEIGDWNKCADHYIKLYRSLNKTDYEH